jgi:serine/threonine protein kinase
VPRIFECGRLGGRPWIAIAHEDGTTLHDELQHRRLEVREVLALLEEVAAFLSHAHARGVLHGNITPLAIIRAPTLRLQRWENARIHDTDLVSEALDGCDDVFALGKTVSAALATPHAAPEALTRLLRRMLAVDPAMRPTAPELVKAARAIRDSIGFIDAIDVEHALEALPGDSSEDGLEIEIEYPQDHDADDEPILLDRRRPPTETVIVDLDACG